MRKLFSLFAAVLFAGSMMAAVKEYTVTISTSDFPGSSYAANNGTHKSTAVAADESTMEVEWTSNQIMVQSSKIQGQKNTGYIYNAATWGNVKSITINDNENFTYVIGAEAQPTATAEGGFFKISAGSATSKASSIVIVFEADASVPVLKASDVALGTVIFEGEIGSILDSVEVTAANLTEDIAVSTTSEKIELGATSIDKAGGILRFVVNSGKGEVKDTITLTSGELVAKVVVTGHFYEKVKNPGFAATFEAGTEYSQGGDSTFVNGDKAVKAGTSNNAGSAIITLPAIATKLHFMAAAWSGKPCTMTLATEDATLDVDSIKLTADAGIANSSPFFTAEGDLTKYQYTVNISGAKSDISIVATTTGNNKRFVIWDVTYEVGDDPEPVAQVSVIEFTADAAKGTLNDSIFFSEDSLLKLAVTDTDNKMAIDANNAKFGDANAQEPFAYRLKSGGKSSSKNNLKLTAAVDGKLLIAARTSTASDTTRTVVLVQEGDTLYNELVLEKDTLPGKIYPFIMVDVKAGDIAVTYPVNAINFYAFALVVEETPIESDTVKLEMNDGYVSNEYFEYYGSTDVVLFNIPVVNNELAGDGDYLDISLFPEDPNHIAGYYDALTTENLDIEYTYLMRVQGTDTTEIDFVDGVAGILVLDPNEEMFSATLSITAYLTTEDGTVYSVEFAQEVYYDFIETEEGLEEILSENSGKTIKFVQNGQIYILKGNKVYGIRGELIR